jgi:hypothetical protein
MSAFFRRGRLNIDRTSLATPDPPATPLSSARVPHSSTSHQPAPLTTGSSPSLSFPIVDPHCHGQSVPVRLRPPVALNRKPVGLGLVPDPFPTGRRPSAGRILPGITGAKEGEIPCSWLPWAEGPYGPDGSCRRSPMTQCDLFFSIRFIHFNIQVRI